MSSKNYKRNYYYLFVYGTLMRGFHNNILLKNATFVGEGYTQQPYTMYAAGIPFVNENKPNTQIKGEVYLVNERVLSLIDQLEGYNPKDTRNNWYERKLIPVELEDRNLHCFIYFNNKEFGEIIKTGNYKDYFN